MTTDNPIAKHLKEYHCGELRVVPSRELEAAFSDPRTRPATVDQQPTRGRHPHLQL